ncbi:hypothetical protein B0A81_02600 [Flavobacterium plurextorum]|uniref:META domain-containing protein n=1 Tax=Flavobacterium plurextorum TaxID=1114867 RepID=A0ABX4D0B2_9FLAO|nr:hypothetical protein [Flavobacterium plurextorum]OXB10872.1 hypothetical protein B0A81_02600 [Flavobacterium plurextorum]
MIKSKIILFSISFLFFLNSCGKCIETHLTDEERIWFKAYEKGQIIVFKSNLGNLDTLLVHEKNEGHGNENCNYYGIGPIQPHIMNITLKRKNCKNESNCNAGISISKNKENEKCFPGFYAFGLYQDGNLKDESSKVTNFKLSTVKTIYNEVYHFEDGLNAKNVTLVFLKSFYWDKKGGLIRYDTNEGEIFELLKITK